MGRVRETLERLRQVIRGGGAEAVQGLGPPSALTGLEAVEAVERRIGSRIATGWDPRATLTQAAGLSLAGARAAAILERTDLMGVGDVLASLAGRQAPLVVHASLRAPSSHAVALGSGHEGWHAVADAGAVQLLASTVQEAADLTLVARMLSEAALVPVVVGMDGPETADSVQDVVLPSADLVDALLGDPGDAIDARTPAQRRLLGQRRRRVPRWTDPDAAVLVGATQGPRAWGAAGMARQAFVGAHVTECLAQAAAALAGRTGRAVGSLAVEGPGGLALVVQGAAIPTARAVAQALTAAGDPTRVVGLRALRPFPGADLAEALEGARAVLVLERALSVLSSGALTREVALALSRAGRPAPIRTVQYALGGAPLRAADLAEACRRGLRLPSLVTLGGSLGVEDEGGPHREAAATSLREDYPDLDALGVVGEAPGPDLGGSSVRISIHRTAGEIGPQLSHRATRLIHALVGGHVQLRVDPRSEAHDQPARDRLLVGSEPLCWPGDDAVPHLCVVAGAAVHPLVVPETDPHVRLVPRGEHAEAWLLGGLVRSVLDRLGDDTTAARASGALLELAPDTSEDQAVAFCAAWDDGGGVETPSARRSLPRTVVPEAARRLEHAEPGLADLPGFWRQVGSVFAQSASPALSGDPLLAGAAVPSRTATLRRVSETRSLLPALDPAACNGCGRCWTACPDAAIRPAALSAKELVRWGADRASTSGLGPLAGRLATRAARDFAAAQPPPATAGALLRPAFEAVAQVGDPARLAAASAALEDVVAAVGDLPLVRGVSSPADPTLLSLVIDPDTCKGCGACVAACDERALVPSPPTAERVAAGRAQARLWEALPHPADIRVDQVGTTTGAAAAIQLRGDRLLALAGADDAAPGSGEKLALRLCLAALEEHGSPRRQARLTSLEQLRSALESAVRERMAHGAPGVEALAKGLEGSVLDDAWSLGRLAGRVEDAAGAQAPIEVQELSRLARLAVDVGALRERLATGPTGQGRSPGVVVVAAGLPARWIGAFPHNPFAVPVAVDPTGCAAPLCLGIAEALVDRIAREATLIRTARAALDPRAGEVEVPQTWDDLSDEERGWCPPLLVVAGPGSESTLGHLRDLLYSRLPAKVLVLTDHAPDDPQSPDERADLGVAALGGCPAFALQSSVARVDHLVSGVLEALAFPGPALIHVHAPVPSRRAAPLDSAQALAERAVAERRFPVFRFDPRAHSPEQSGLDLAGNPPADDGVAASRSWRVLQHLAGIETPAGERIRKDVTERLTREMEQANDARQAQWERSAVDRVTNGLLELAGFGEPR